MATKNLARTVVEGGRDPYSKLYRKLRNGRPTSPGGQDDGIAV
jgi:hypothetical protein